MSINSVTGTRVRVIDERVTKMIVVVSVLIISHYCLLSFKNGFIGSIKMVTPDTFPCFKYILAKSGDKGFDGILIIKKLYLG